MAVESATQHRLLSQRAAFAREIGEDGLDDVFGKMRVVAGAADRHRVNEIDLTGDEFPEGRLRTVFRVIAQQLVSVGHTFHQL